MIVELELHKKLIIKRLEFVTEKITKELAGERFSMANFKFLIIAELIGIILKLVSL